MMLRKWCIVQHSTEKGYTEEQQLQELTSDLVGDYIFGDSDFIANLSTENPNIFKKIYNEIKYLWKMATAGSKEKRQLETAKKKFEDAWKEANNTDIDAQTKFSIGEIIDANNKSYGVGVHLDSNLLDELSPKERVEIIKEYVKELGGQSFSAYDSKGNKTDIMVVESQKKFKNSKGKRVPANKDLTTKNIGNEVKQEAIAHVDELIVAAEFDNRKSSAYSHDWIDNQGKNDWEYWNTYIRDKNNAIWKATLNVANTTNGEKVLYDINPIKKVGQSVESDTSPTTVSLPQKSENASQKDSNFTSDVDISYSQNYDGTEIKTDRASEVQFSLANDTQYMDNAIAKNNASLAVDAKLMDDA